MEKKTHIGRDDEGRAKTITETKILNDGTEKTKVSTVKYGIDGRVLPDKPISKSEKK